jgi:RNA polymerase sigma-70 factor (ECF subfamily)
LPLHTGGLWKTEDGGDTWTNLPLAESSVTQLVETAAPTPASFANGSFREPRSRTDVAAARTVVLSCDAGSAGFPSDDSRRSRSKIVGVSTDSATPTALLLAWGRGDTTALNRLVPLVHDELHRIARRYMAGERPGHTLQTSALVNEAYLRLIDITQVKWQNRTHFLAMAAKTMRRILVDSARARNNRRRGGDIVKVTLDDAVAVASDRRQDLVALDEALEKLQPLHPRQASVVELRFFGGLTLEETAAALDVSTDTVKRDFRFAKLWLLRELRESPPA